METLTKNVERQIETVWSDRPYVITKKPLKKIGDWEMHKLFRRSYLYTYKNVAVTNLAGRNSELLQSLADGVEPEENTQNRWNYRRCIETLSKHKQAGNL